MKSEQLVGAAADLASGARDIGGVSFVGHRAEGVGGADVRSLAIDIRGRIHGRPAVVVVIGTAGDRPSAVVAVNDDARQRGLAAGDLIKVVGENIGGRGGGKADIAQGGGTDLSGIEKAFAAVESEILR